MNDIIEDIKKATIQIHKKMQLYIPSNTPEKSVNTSGDIQKPLDIISNDIIKNLLLNNQNIAGIISEEEGDFVSGNPNGKYIVSFDPMDGSGNSQINLSSGSIFCVFCCNKLNEISGRKIAGAIYSIYGAMLELVVVTSDEKSRYYYDAINKRYHDPIKLNNIPEQGNIYVINEGNSKRWDQRTRLFVEKMKPRSLRWMACFVADVHRLLIQGGVFLYPKDEKQKQGKLRLLYEAFPMAYIWEKCGGISSFDCVNSILDIPFEIDQLHVKIPVYLFGKYEYQVYQDTI